MHALLADEQARVLRWGGGRHARVYRPIKAVQSASVLLDLKHSVADGQLADVHVAPDELSPLDIHKATLINRMHLGVKVEVDARFV